MRKLVLVLIVAFSLRVSAQPDPAKWYVFPNTFMQFNGTNPWCESASQVTISAGILTETAAYGSNTCQTHTTNYNTGAMISRSFSFTYGTVKVRAKASSTGVHSGVIWMWGGDTTSSGYPPTCVNTLMTMTAGNAFYNCATNSIPSYEIDIGEVAPASTGLSTTGNWLHIWQNGAFSSSSGGNANIGTDLSASFHVYELDWSPTQLVFKVDGTTTTTVTYSLGVPMFLIMDQEIDNSAPPQTSGFYPTTSQYDYVRVCSSPTATCDPGDSTMIFEDEFNGGKIVTGAVPSGAIAY